MEEAGDGIAVFFHGKRLFEIPAQSQSPIPVESGRGLAETPSDLSAVLMLALKSVKANLG
jgi:hypothetical protein